MAEECLVIQAVVVVRHDVGSEASLLVGWHDVLYEYHFIRAG